MKKTTDLFNHGLESGMRRLAAPTAALAFALGGCAGVYAQEKVWFDPILMEQGDPGQRGVDLSIFSTKDRLPAGNYPLRIRLTAVKCLPERSRSRWMRKGRPTRSLRPRCWRSST
ncbi:type 1 fimbriae anchoring protein FimD [Cronobacter universalis NCTC 9529]|nr:type 1 fimbriae anchoring protein FimD [Cronobacter universalis NCTC 9529]